MRPEVEGILTIEPIDLQFYSWLNIHEKNHKPLLDFNKISKATFFVLAKRKLLYIKKGITYFMVQSVRTVFLSDRVFLK